MEHRPPRRRWGCSVNSAQRCIGYLACMAIAICTVGVPLPAQGVRKSGDPFPCQNCPCGCRDAETCWRDCCCHTNQEKLAWARKHGVTPPAFVVAASRNERRQAKAGGSCCRDKGRADCRRLAAATAASCDRSQASACDGKCTPPAEHSGTCPRCSAEYKTAGQKRPRPERPGEDQPGSAVLLLAKLRCGGISLSTSLLPPSVVVKPTLLALEAPEQFDVTPRELNLYEPPSLAVPAPPPDLTDV